MPRNEGLRAELIDAMTTDWIEGSDAETLKRYATLRYREYLGRLSLRSLENRIADPARGETNRLRFIATVEIERAMNECKITAAELAQRMGVDVSEVADCLSGETYVTFEFLAAVGVACGVVWDITIREEPE